MRWNHESFGAIRGVVAVFVILTVVPCGDLVAKLQAASPAAQSIHRSSGANHSDKARRMVTNLGVGRHVDVTLTWGERIEGEIREIADDHFVVILDGTAASADITYGNVRQLGPIVLQPVSRSWRPGKRGLMGVVVVVLAEIFIIHECAGRSC